MILPDSFEEEMYLNMRFPVPSPLAFLPAEERAKLINLESKLKKRIVGQDEAISAVCRAIRRSKVGFKDPNRPVAGFIFTGATGTGKTALCKALAQALYVSEDNLIKLDMSEYSTRWDVTKLMGASPGFVGYDDGGQLANLIKQNLQAVVCFDEVEKAHSDIHNVFLQILDDGVLTTAKGEKVSFCETVIIMTSNIGSDAIFGNAKPIGFSGNYDETANKKDKITSALKQTFRPEFLNRLDEIVVFNPLSKNHIRKICKIMLDEVKQRAQRLQIKLDFDRVVVAKLALEGFDREYGARPLRRLISTRIEDILAEQVLAGVLNLGDDVRVIFDGNEFKIDKKKSAVLCAAMKGEDELW